MEVFRHTQNNYCSQMIVRLPKVPKKTVYCCYFYHLLFVFFSSSFCSIINFLSRKMCTTTLKYQNIRIGFHFNNSTLNVVQLRISMDKEKEPDPNCRGPLLGLCEHGSLESNDLGL